MSSTLAFSISRINASTFTINFFNTRILDFTNKCITFTSSSNPALYHECRHNKASRVSGLRIILDIPKTSFPTLNALSLDALVAGMVKMSLAIHDKGSHLRDLCAQYSRMPSEVDGCVSSSSLSSSPRFCNSRLTQLQSKNFYSSPLFNKFCSYEGEGHPDKSTEADQGGQISAFAPPRVYKSKTKFPNKRFFFYDKRAAPIKVV
ncbi:hypothetical protein OUZ56_033640 [Daphnia magna]|uniref:Uncharacterized protein n=1 Tax=Daphnia magna TaxID=35525 RepID=A0ABR0BAY0_9CRUS|nr:hypothetical protein OUZ56_033640 [Daphnia magna]